MYDQNFEPYYQTRPQKPNKNSRPTWIALILAVLIAALAGGILSACVLPGTPRNNNEEVTRLQQ